MASGQKVAFGMSETPSTINSFVMGQVSARSLWQLTAFIKYIIIIIKFIGDMLILLVSAVELPDLYTAQFYVSSLREF
jgi:hypothetical protein